MCNIAAYAGTRPAAEILIEMMRREEGWNAGYYTGLATVADGRIHMEKLTGDLSRLLEKTPAASLPGTVGLIHSRTQSGGGDEWAHPFLGGRGENPSIAYIANGSPGFWESRIDNEVSLIAADLANAGYPFRSRVQEKLDEYPVLPDGDCVHASEVLAQYIAEKIDRGISPDEAISRAFCEQPEEFIGLLISLARPEGIAWARVNMPVFAAFADHGAYLASTPQAFPEDAGEPVLLPAMSAGFVFADHFTAAPIQGFPGSVAPITPRVIREASCLIEETLMKEEKTAPQLFEMVKPLFDRADCCPAAALVYTVLYDLQRQGRLKKRVSLRPGVFEGLSAPLFTAGL